MWLEYCKKLRGSRKLKEVVPSLGSMTSLSCLALSIVIHMSPLLLSLKSNWTAVDFPQYQCTAIVTRKIVC